MIKFSSIQGGRRERLHRKHEFFHKEIYLEIIISILLVLKCSPTNEIMVIVDGGFKKMALFAKIKSNSPIF